MGSNHPPGPNWASSIQAQSSKSQGRVARISTLEIAIRAQAKRLLAHPLVIQQLEAIWAGTIVFHHGMFLLAFTVHFGFTSKGPTLTMCDSR